MQRMYKDMAQSFKAGEKAGRNATKKDKRVTKFLNQLDPTGLGNKMIDTHLEVGGHMAGQVAGAVAAYYGTVVSFVGATADAFSELFGPNNDLERELAQGHYQKEKFFSESQGENEKYKTQKLTKAIAKADQVVDTVVTVVATVLAAASLLFPPLAVVTVPAIIALVAWKAARGMYEGGFAGAGLAAGTAATNVVLEGMGSHLNVNASYSYANGFSAGIGVSTLGANDVGLGLTAGLNYNEKSGFGASVGMEYAFGGQYVPNFNVGAAYNVNSINRPGQNANISLSGRMDNYSVSAWRDIKDNNKYGASFSLSGKVTGNNAIGSYTGSLTWTNGQGFGNSFSYGFSSEFMKDINQNVRDPFIDFMTSMTKNAKDVAFGAAGYVTGLFKDEEKELQSQLDEFGYSVDPKTGNVYYLDSKGNTMITSKENFIKIIESEFNGDGLTMVVERGGKNSSKNSKLDGRIIQRFEGNQIKLVKDEMLKRINSSGTNINGILSAENATLLQKYFGNGSYAGIAEGIETNNIRNDIKKSILNKIGNDWTAEKLAEVENQIADEGKKAESGFKAAYNDFFNVKSQTASDATNITAANEFFDFMSSKTFQAAVLAKRQSYIEYLANRAIETGEDPTESLLKILNKRDFLTTVSPFNAQSHIPELERQVYQRPFEQFEIDYYYQMYIQKSKDKAMKDIKRNRI